MKKEKFYEAITEIDDVLVEKAENYCFSKNLNHYYYQ